MHLQHHDSTARSMTQGSIVMQLVPLMLGNVFQMLYNTVDSIVVGNFVGTEALAAVGSTTMIVNIMVFFFNGFSTGATVVIARRFGAGKHEELHTAIQTTMAATFILAVVFTVVGLLSADVMLRIIATPEDVMDAAATYLRGVAFMQIPTTLLSQVDSSIGGKTGVDFDAYKNMVGAFHMPKLVFTNINTLQTLPDNQFSAGMGEVIKHGLIKDAAYYEWLLENAADIWARKPEALRKTVTWSNEIKRAVVEKDPTEKGDRMLLNFGHTLGHAIEKLKNFELLHGECVALGALAAMKLSENRGMIKPEETNRFKEALGEFHIGTQVSGLEKDAIVAASKNDKKMDSGIIKFILIRSIGDAYVDRTVTEDEMKQALDQVLV